MTLLNDYMFFMFDNFIHIYELSNFNYIKTIEISALRYISSNKKTVFLLSFGNSIHTTDEKLVIHEKNFLLILLMPHAYAQMKNFYIYLIKIMNQLAYMILMKINWLTPLIILKI
jgi:hypothetical protein